MECVTAMDARSSFSNLKGDFRSAANQDRLCVHKESLAALSTRDLYLTPGESPLLG